MNSRIKELVTVIIPTFNRADKIQRAVQSVLDQTYAPIEILVADDGSTDQTASLMREKKQNCPQLHYLPGATNQGAQNARNRGIAAAQGKWVIFLDSDDTFLPQAIENLVQFAQNTGSQLVHCAFALKRVGEPPLLFRPSMRDGEIYQKLLLNQGPTLSSILVRTDYLRQIGTLDESLPAYQEWDTLIRLARGTIAGYLDEPSYIYNVGNVDSISNQSEKGARAYAQIVQKNYDAIQKNHGQAGLAHHQRRLCRLWLDAGNFPQARQAWFLAFNQECFNFRLWAYFPLLFLGKNFYHLIKKIIKKNNKKFF